MPRLRTHIQNVAFVLFFLLPPLPFIHDNYYHFFCCCLFLLRATRRMRWWTTVALHCVDSWTAFVIIFLLCVWCMLSAVLYAFTLAQFVCVQTASSHIRSVFMVYSANDMASNRMTPKRKMTKSNSFSNGFLYWIERVRERNWLNVRCLCSILW